jgi:SAM-dependent methyltransferase
MAERDYILGTHDDELTRLELQHRVWRPRALDAWTRAGFTVGQTLLDVGCGPGFATLDLADIVGRQGRVVAVDRSRRFLDALQSRGLPNVETRELDLDESPLPPVNADGAWVRWVFAFVKQPRTLLARVAAALKPGGVLAIHEYFDYASWRFRPRSEALEEFVRVIITSWRASGGEPDIGLDLPVWLRELGFTNVSLTPIVDVVSPASFIWQWPKAFLANYPDRLVDLGYLDSAGAGAVHAAVRQWESSPHAIMFTPAVLEIIATRNR